MDSLSNFERTHVFAELEINFFEEHLSLLKLRSPELPEQAREFYDRCACLSFSNPGALPFPQFLLFIIAIFVSLSPAAGQATAK